MGAQVTGNHKDANPRQLRIGICLSLYWPVESGAERQARRQAHELARRGHKITVYTRPAPGHPTMEMDGDVTVCRKIRTCGLGPLFGMTFLASLAWRLWRDRRNLDLIHCHQASWEAVAAGWVHRKTGMPTIAQPAASGPYGEVRMMRQVLGRRWVLSNLLSNTCFVAISGQIERELLELGVPRDKLDRFASGVDVGQFAPGDSAREAELCPRPRVLFLGRLHPQKNLANLLQAWRIVHDQLPTANLLLAGDGPLRDQLGRQVAELQLNQCVHFLGAVADPLSYLQAADVFVLPSISEGMSNSLLEAMSCALPAVVSSVGGNVDLVEHEKTGLVADAGDPADLARQISRMVQDTSLRQRCGTAARRLITQQYSLASIVDRYESLYFQLSRGAGNFNSRAASKHASVARGGSPSGPC